MWDARITDMLSNIWEDQSNNYMIDLTDQAEERVRENLKEEEDAANILFCN